MKRFIAVLALLAALQGVSSAQQKGFQGFVSVGRNDAITAGEIDNDVLTLKTFDLIGGYRFLPNQFVGAGVELQFSELLDACLFNIFVDYRANLKPSGAWTPFVDLRAGCIPGGDDIGFSGGAFYGMHYTIHANTGFMAMLGIQVLHKENATLFGPAVRFGFSF